MPPIDDIIMDSPAEAASSSTSREEREPVTLTFDHDIDQVAAALLTGTRILVVSHLRPDGDAVGSVVGLTRALRKIGKHVDIGLVDPPPQRFAFLLEDEQIVKPGSLDLDYDVIVSLDAGDLGRTGFEGDLSEIAALLLNIDHHASNTAFGDINFLDFEASSTCEMIVQVLKAVRIPLDPEIAEGLYLGLLTDSRFFQNESLRPSAHTAAAALLASGLKAAPILSILNGSRALAELKILGRGLSKLEIHGNGRLAMTVLTASDLRDCEATLEHLWASGLFNQLTSITGVTVSLGVVEGPDGKSYCEFRSRGGFDVKEIAVAMGGGGHLAASGCNRVAAVTEFADEARQRLLAKLVLGTTPSTGKSAPDACVRAGTSGEKC